MAFLSSSILLKAAAALLCVGISYTIYARLSTLSRQHRLATQHKCLPPPALPQSPYLLGIDHLLRVRRALKAHRILREEDGDFRRLGHTYTAHLSFLGLSFIQTIDPENVKHVLSTDFESYSIGKGRIKALTKTVGKGIFTTDGEDWKHSREMLRPSFARSQVADTEQFETHVKRLLAAVPKEAGETVDLAPLFFDLTFGVITEFLFGVTVGELAAPGVTDTEEVSRRVEKLQREMDRCGAFGTVEDMKDPGLLDFFRMMLFTDKRFEQAVKYINDTLDTFLETKIEEIGTSKFAEKDARLFFLRELVAQTTDKIRIRSELLNIHFAGRDTTACFLANLVWELSRRPDVRSRLQTEVDALEGRYPTFEELKNMHYLQAFMKESQRLYPIVPGDSREAIRDTYLPSGGGPDGTAPVFVPKGTNVVWRLWSMHRREDLFGEEVEEFKPERWLDEDGKKGLRPGWAYVPFNGGPRACIGQNFALTESGYVLVRLMQEFEKIESRDPEPWTEKLTLVCTGNNGCKVALYPRAP